MRLPSRCRQVVWRNPAQAQFQADDKSKQQEQAQKDVQYYPHLMPNTDISSLNSCMSGHVSGFEMLKHIDRRCNCAIVSVSGNAYWIDPNSGSTPISRVTNPLPKSSS